MHKGITIAIAKSNDSDPEPQIKDLGWLLELLVEFSLATISSTALYMLEEALHGPNVNKWQAASDYKVGQLEKLKTWVIED